MIATFGSRPAGVIGARTPSAASRVRRASCSRLDTQRAGGAAGFRSSRCWDPRAATARAEARTAPRSTGARHREVAEQASSHQGVPWENFQSKIRYRNRISRKISNFFGAGQELAWRVSDQGPPNGPSSRRSPSPTRPASGRSFSRPYTTAGGKTAHVPVQRVDQPASATDRTWGPHERIAVRRATAEEGKR